VGATELWKAYKEFTGTKITQTAFGGAMNDAQFDRVKQRRGKVYIRVALRQEFWAGESKDR
jgi:hypothetical protein